MRPFPAICSVVQRVATMAISDANKMLMLESEGAIETILKGLLLSSPRRSEDGADAVQEACAALLLSLALYGPWAEVLRAHTVAMRALHDLHEGDAGTETSRRSAESRSGTGVVTLLAKAAVGDEPIPEVRLCWSLIT